MSAYSFYFAAETGALVATLVQKHGLLETFSGLLGLAVPAWFLDDQHHKHAFMIAATLQVIVAIAIAGTLPCLGRLGCGLTTCTAPSIDLRRAALLPKLLHLTRVYDSSNRIQYQCQYLLDTLCASPRALSSSGAHAPTQPALSIVDATDNMIIFPDQRTVRSDSWTFETVLANVPVPDKGDWLYEVRWHGLSLQLIFAMS